MSTKNDFASDFKELVQGATKKWTRTRNSEERNPASRSQRTARMTQERGVSIKDAAAAIMRSAYMQASGNDTLPANTRQVMYVARGHIQGVTGRQLDDNYFTQTLLPDYVEENDLDWDVVYDARGHFTEPHDEGESFGLGTLEVRSYLDGFHAPRVKAAGFRQAEVETAGPNGRFGAVLFIEKEGFGPLLRAAQIAEKYDIAIMSTKGMSVTAARQLVDQMCFDHKIPLLVLHDFDKAGFSIAGTLQRDTRRYDFRNKIEVIDLGLRLADVEAMSLQDEYQHHPRQQRRALEANLRVNGASEDEIAWMFQDFDRLRSTRRVELNAMTSPQFIDFLERKLRENGIEKIVPADDCLQDAYAAMVKGSRLERSIRTIVEADLGPVAAPPDLAERLKEALSEDRTMKWDEALAKLVADDQAELERQIDELLAGGGNEPSP